MASDGLRHPVRVSLVLYPLHRKVMWDLRAAAGMASASRVLRHLIREATPATLGAMQQHFTGQAEVRGLHSRFTRPSLLLDGLDLAQLDRLAEAAEAPSRSAAARFLILNAGRGDRKGGEAGP